MKYGRKTLTVLMTLCHVLADANTPTDDGKRRLLNRLAGLCASAKRDAEAARRRKSGDLYAGRRYGRRGRSLYSRRRRGEITFMSESGPGAAGKVLRA